MKDKLQRELKRHTDRDAVADAVTRHQADFKSADAAWIGTTIHICVLLMCAIYSWRFFFEASNGESAYFTALLAIGREVFAAVTGCVFINAAGRYRKALLAITIGLTALAILDGSLGWMHSHNAVVTGMVLMYKENLAFAFLIAQCVTACLIERLFHPSARIREEQAQAADAIAASNARLVRDARLAENEHLDTQRRIEQMSQALEQKRQIAAQLSEYLTLSAETEAQLAQADTDTREGLARFFGGGKSLPSPGIRPGFAPASETENDRGKGSRR